MQYLPDIMPFLTTSFCSVKLLHASPMGLIIWRMYMFYAVLNLCGIFLRVLIAGVSMPFVEKKTISCKVLVQVPIVLK
jgi:hypothetical protein